MDYKNTPYPIKFFKSEEIKKESFHKMQGIGKQDFTSKDQINPFTLSKCNNVVDITNLYWYVEKLHCPVLQYEGLLQGVQEAKKPSPPGLTPTCLVPHLLEVPTTAHHLQIINFRKNI